MRSSERRTQRALPLAGAFFAFNRSPGSIDRFATVFGDMQARYYDPVIGRFLSTDPIGYQDQLNLYAYVHNDPVNGIDPTGMECSASRIGTASGSICMGSADGEFDGDFQVIESYGGSRVSETYGDSRSDESVNSRSLRNHWKEENLDNPNSSSAVRTDPRTGIAYDQFGRPVGGPDWGPPENASGELRDFLIANPDHPLNNPDYRRHVRDLNNANFSVVVGVSVGAVEGARQRGPIGAFVGGATALGVAGVTGVYVNRSCDGGVDCE